MARFRSAVPALGVYFVKFASIARCAAAFTASGVAKSGSPAPKSMTSMPARRIRSTAVATFIVGDPAIRLVRGASSGILFVTQALFHDVGHQAVHAAAEGEDFLDQPRTDVRVLLGGHHEDGL